MATGPEHYRKAEMLLADAFASNGTTFEGHNPEADRLVAAAQVHATLAQAAATALGSDPEGMDVRDHMAWARTVSAKSKPEGSDS